MPGLPADYQARNRLLAELLGSGIGSIARYFAAVGGWEQESVCLGQEADLYGNGGAISKHLTPLDELGRMRDSRLRASANLSGVVNPIEPKSSPTSILSVLVQNDG